MFRFVCERRPTTAHRDDPEDPCRQPTDLRGAQVHAELRLGHGIRCGKKRVARLMCAAGLQGVHRRRRVRTTRRDETAAPACPPLSPLSALACTARQGGLDRAVPYQCAALNMSQLGTLTHPFEALYSYLDIGHEMVSPFRIAIVRLIWVFILTAALS